MEIFRRFLNAKSVAGFLAIFTVLGLLFALFMQHIVGVEPCPLCITQRYELIGVGLCALVAYLLSRFHSAYIVMMTFSLVFSLLGILTSGWQNYIQWNRPDSVECGFGFETIVSNYPLTEAVPMIFAANGECAIPSYIIPGILTIPQATFVTFIFTFAVASYGLYLKRRERKL